MFTTTKVPSNSPIDNPKIFHYPCVMEEREVTLTKREKEILLLVANGMNAKEIGEKLGISYNTVKSIKAKMMGKYRVNTVAHLIKVTVEIWNDCEC